MIFVNVKTKEELYAVHDAWSKKYPRLERWPKRTLDGIPIPRVLGLIVPDIDNNGYINNVFYTGYEDKNDCLSFEKFNEKYIYKPPKTVRQLKFESLITKTYIYDNTKDDISDFRIIFNKMKENMFNFKIHPDGIELVKITNTPGNQHSFGNYFYDLFDNDYRGLLGIFLEARRKNDNKKIIRVAKIDWIGQIVDLIDEANSVKLSSSKYVRQLKFESFEDFVKE